MPEMRTPGVFVEEVGFRGKAIEGVGTSTAAFIGPTRVGPVADRADGALPELLASLVEFRRVYGDADDLLLNGRSMPNYVARAAKAFFENGGTRLYVVRISDEFAARAGGSISRDDAGGEDTDGSIVPAYREAMRLLERLEDVSIVAAPGYSADAANGPGIERELVAHAERPRSYRIAVLDAPPNATVSDMLVLRQRVESSFAAMYYPWVVVENASGNQSGTGELPLPPSGFVCGIYARVDAARGVWRAPAGEAVIGAQRFSRDIGRADQEALNPAGLNVLRTFEGRGHQLWGARTLSSDSDFRYVNVRRFLIFLEHSIDRGTQWVVFEPNGEALWAAVRRTIEDFLMTVWRQGALMGDTPDKAFFVRCDRTTMTQNDLDDGRLVCLVGVAPVKPAEFVVFRIGQLTADTKA